MDEGSPTPINRGIEIQKNKIEGIVRQATGRYKELAALSQIVEARLDTELLALADEPVDYVEILWLFDQKHALEEIGRELEALILRNFAHLDDLAVRWNEIERRILLVESEVGAKAAG